METKRPNRRAGRPGSPASAKTGNSSVLAALDDLRAEATRQRGTFGNAPTACAIEFAIQRVEAALQQDGGEILSLAEASARSGYTEDHLARLVRDGRIPDLRPPGYLGRIFIRAADLPLKPASPHISLADDTHSPDASVEARRA